MNFKDPDQGKLGNPIESDTWIKTWGRATYSVPIQEIRVPQACLYDGDPLEPGKEPIRIPIRRTYSGHILYCGVCCSLACAVAFMENNPRYFSNRSRDLLVEISREMFGINQPLLKARPIFSLAKYGGYLTIEQFRSYGPQHYSVLKMPPFEPQELRVIDTVPQGEIRSTKSREEFLRELQDANEQVKAKKRRHSEKLYQNSLESLMGKKSKAPMPPPPDSTIEPFALPTLPPIAELSAAPEPALPPSLPAKVRSPRAAAAKPKGSKKTGGGGNFFSAFRSATARTAPAQ